MWGGKIGGEKNAWFRRITLLCLWYRLSKPKWLCSKNFGGHGPLGPPGYAYAYHQVAWQHIELLDKQKSLETPGLKALPCSPCLKVRFWQSYSLRSDLMTKGVYRNGLSPCLKTWFWQSYSLCSLSEVPCPCWLRYGYPRFGELGFDRPTLCNLVRKRETLHVPTLADALVLKREMLYVPTLSDDLVLKRDTLYVPTLSDDLVLKTMLIELLSINSSVVSVIMHISSVIFPSDSS